MKINREQYWQCALLFPKGEADKIRSQGLEQFRHQLALIDPDLKEAVETLSSWDDVKFLDVQVNYLKRWWLPGFLSIGDAAHAMSPVGGVGINLAIQDAVAAARVIAKPLKDGTIMDKHLAKVQKRRAWAARMTQKAQVSAHNNFLYPILSSTKKTPLKTPLFLRILANLPSLRWLPAYGVGIGVRAEHWCQE